MKCSFCKNNITPGTGKLFVKSDGTLIYWCSSKCEKNYKMGAEAKKKKWARSR